MLHKNPLITNSRPMIMHETSITLQNGASQDWGFGNAHGRQGKRREVGGECLELADWS